jgi:hypothetical protein
MSYEREHLDLSVTIGGASFTGAGPADRVEAALARFSELIAQSGAKQPAGAKPDAGRGSGVAEAKEEAAEATPPQKSAASKVPLPTFLEGDGIKGNSKIATAIVIWAAAHDQKDGLTKAEIEARWKGTRLKVPSNTSRDISDAVKAGWLIRDGSTYTASGYGREAIDLPAS